MLCALRISRASEAAIRACRLFRCPECPRLAEPKLPRPSKLPTVDEFGVIVGMDVIEVKDSDQVSWSLLNILDLGTTYQVMVLLDQAVRSLHARLVRLGRFARERSRAGSSTILHE